MDQAFQDDIMVDSDIDDLGSSGSYIDTAVTSSRRDIPSHNVDERRNSPFDLLANEIILEIFQYCLPLGYGSDGFPNLPEPLFSQPPLLLGRVCRTWRRISQATPSLWSGISITDSHPSLNNVIIEVIKEWMLRSQPTHLSIHLNADNREAVLSLNFPLPPLLSELVCHSRRWKHVSFRVGTPYMFLLISLSHKMPELKTLRLATIESNGYESIDLITSRLQIAPQLSECISRAPGLSLKFGPLMTHMQVLEITNQCPIEEFCNILSCCPLLIELAIHITFKRSTKTVSTIYRMEQLRVLDIQWSYDSFFQTPFNFWESFALPALKRLRYMLTGPDRHMEAITWLISWFRCNHIDLHELCLTVIPYGYSEFSDILRLSPNLKSLILCVDKGVQLNVENILRSLVVDSSCSSLLCPKLQAIELRRYRISDCSSLIDMLLSRSSNSVNRSKEISSLYSAPVNALTVLNLPECDPGIFKATILGETSLREVRVNYSDDADLWSDSDKMEYGIPRERVEALSLLLKI